MLNGFDVCLRKANLWCVLALQRVANWGLAGGEACSRGCSSCFQGGNRPVDNSCTFVMGLYVPVEKRHYLSSFVILIFPVY